MSATIPSFYLYGEPHQAVEPDFIHVEALDDRSRPSEWTIRPHAHADLNHLFLIHDGGGMMQADGCLLTFAAPAVLVVPAAVIHGFRWTDESRGWVATLAQPALAAAAAGDRDVTALFDTPRLIPLDRREGARAARIMARLMRELGWMQPGRGSALRSGLLDLFVLALRVAAIDAGPSQPPGRQAALVARFRERIDAGFRHRQPVSAHAHALGVSESALRAACAAIAGRSPGAMVDQRAILEAQRSLRYTSLPVAEVGRCIGIGDAAYFSRFFARHVGVSPARYRLRAAG